MKTIDQIAQESNTDFATRAAHNFERLVRRLQDRIFYCVCQPGECAQCKKDRAALAEALKD